MRITRHNSHYVIRCTPLEFETLGIAVDQIECGEPWDLIPDHLRTSWTRRVHGGPYLRVDRDMSINLVEKEISA